MFRLIAKRAVKAHVKEAASYIRTAGELYGCVGEAISARAEKIEEMAAMIDRPQVWAEVKTIHQALKRLEKTGAFEPLKEIFSISPEEMEKISPHM